MLFEEDNSVMEVGCDPLDFVDELMSMARSGITPTADQEMRAQELGINLSELREFANATEPSYEEEE